LQKAARPKIALKDAIDALPQDQLDRLELPDTLGAVPEICPVLTAFAKAKEIGTGAAWDVSFAKATGLMAGSALAPLELAMQAYRERLLSSDARCNTPADLISARLIKTLGSVAMPAYSHLLDEERDQIAVMRAAGHSICAIAGALQRAKSTVPAGTATQRPAQRAVFAASCHRSLSAAQAA
jgi:hypothetical protein